MLDPGIKKSKLAKLSNSSVSLETMMKFELEIAKLSQELGALGESEMLDLGRKAEAALSLFRTNYSRTLRGLTRTWEERF